MSILDRLTNKPALNEARDRIANLEDELAIQANNTGLFQERLAELELSLEDKGWQVLGSGGALEFSRNALKTINYLARLYFLKNPLIRRAVLTQTQYVFGQGVNIQARHPLINEVIQEFMDDQKNKVELTEHQALMVKETELQCFGNLFFVFFVNASNGHVRVRTIPMDEITEIITNPEDAKDTWYYKREWTTQGINIDTGQYVNTMQTTYYPDWRYKPKGNLPATIGSIQVMVDTPIYHVSVNRLSDMQFGVSEIYAALDWAKAYKEFLEDWATIIRAYSRFAWKLTRPGGAAGVASAKAKLGSTLATGEERNSPPATGSTFISTENVKMEPIRTAGATTSAEDGRFLRLMVSSATGIFDHYLTGDPSTGNLASVTAMEYPMLIMFRDRQSLWISVLREICNFVIVEAVRAGHILGTVERNEYDEEVMVLADDTDSEDPEAQDKPIDSHIDIDFPDILEQDIKARIDAIVAAATLGGMPTAGTLETQLVTRLLLQALGIDDVDEVLEHMYPPEQSVGEEAEALRIKFTEAMKEVLGKMQLTEDAESWDDWEQGGGGGSGGEGRTVSDSSISAGNKATVDKMRSSIKSSPTAKIEGEYSNGDVFAMHYSTPNTNPPSSTEELAYERAHNYAAIKNGHPVDKRSAFGGRPMKVPNPNAKSGMPPWKHIATPPPTVREYVASLKKVGKI